MQKIKTSILTGNIIVIGICCLVITGWLENIQILTKILPYSIAMRFNTAICFLLISTAVLLSNYKGSRCMYYYYFSSTFCVFLISTVTLLEDLTGINIGIDTFFFESQVDPQYANGSIGRMSPLTSASFILFSSSLLVGKKLKYKAYAQYTYNIVSASMIVFIMGYMVSVSELYQFSFRVPIAVNTAICFLILSVGCSLENPESGLYKFFLSEQNGSKIIRRLFVNLCVIIFVLGIMGIKAWHLGFGNTGLNTAILLIAIITVLSYFCIKTANLLDKTQSTLLNAEKSFREMFEMAPVALLACDKKGIIIMANRQSEVIFGYKKNELFSQRIDNLIGKDNRFDFQEDGILNFQRNAIAYQKNGYEIPVDFQFVNTSNVGAELRIYSITDNTERVNYENIINQKVIELRNKNKELERLTYIVSHDLQEPLRTVESYIVLLREDYAQVIDSDIDNHLRSMSSSIQRMSALIRHILHYGQLEKDKKMSEVDCNKLLRSVCEDLSGIITKFGAVITIVEMPVILCYETELRQVFQNLIHNAIKFKRPGITPEIRVESKVCENFMEFVVSDNGTGIDSKYFHKIFEIFHKLPGTSNLEGYGVGLANCAKIVALHRGKIWVESSQGNGSTFKFTIPINNKLYENDPTNNVN